jgi:arginine deiminase
MLGDRLADQVRRHLEGLDPEALTEVLISGLTAAELPGAHGVVYRLLGGTDYIIEPLPNLVFVRDCCAWIGDHVAVASPVPPDRRVQALLADIIYAHHPAFAGTKTLYRPGLEPLEGGDVLLIAPGVVAVGCSLPGVERLARRVFDAGLAHTVLVVSPGQSDGHPVASRHCAPFHEPGKRLDALCTAYSMTARVVTPGGDGLRASHPQAFLVAAAQAAGVDRLRVVETALDPVTGGSGPWDDGGNLLVLRPGLVISHERNVATNARLERCGIEVITVPGGELSGVRGGPRSMCCPVSRDPALLPGD